MQLFTFVLAIVAILGAVSATKDPKTVCYYESWVHWRHGDGKMDPEDIDNSLCTHIVYSYFGIDSKTHELKLLDEYLMNDLHDMEHFVTNAGKAVAMIAIGGATMSDQFSRTAGSEEYRTAFVKSVVEFLAKNKFGGVILDWYGAGPDDTDNMVSLLNKFDDMFASTSYVLAMSVPADVNFMDNYAVSKFIKYLDFLNILTIDYAGPWSKTVGHASPLPKQFETLENYHYKGAPRDKIVMSVPLFARTWKLVSASKQEVGDGASSAGSPGPFTETAGLLSYNELCTLIKAKPNAFSVVRDDDNTAVYAIYMHGSTAEFISFEDSKTLAKKAHNITSEGYGGITIYTLSNEDSHGICGKKYPLLHALTENYNTLEGTERPDVTRPTTTPAPPTQPPTDPPGVFNCHKEGAFRDPVYCFKYYECSATDFGTFEKSPKLCDKSEAFDESSKKCVPREQIAGCDD